MCFWGCSLLPPFHWNWCKGILELPERAVRQALGSLVNLSVLRRPDLGYEVSHPLVHTFATERLSSQVRAASFPSLIVITTWRERFLATLATHFDQSDPYDRIALALWQPHVFPLVSTGHLTAEHPLKTAHLFNVVGFDAFYPGQVCGGRAVVCASPGDPRAAVGSHPS